MEATKATKLVFLHFPCRVVVCESIDSPDCKDPETHDLREYARITPRTEEVGGVWITQFEFAGEIEWSKHAHMLSDDQREQIEAYAECIAEANKEATAKAKELQAYQRKKYADKAAKYGEY